MHSLLINFFFGSEMQSAPESHTQNHKAERNQLQPVSLPQTSRVEVHLQKGWQGNLRRQGGEHPAASCDTQPSMPLVQNRPLSHLKMGFSHFKCNQADISDWWPQSGIWGKTAEKRLVRKPFWVTFTKPEQYGNPDTMTPNQLETSELINLLLKYICMIMPPASPVSH